MPEEQQVAISVQGVNSPGENSLMGEFSLGKNTGLQTLECLYVFAAAKGVGRSPCLCVLCLSHWKHPVLLGIFIYGLSRR